MTTTIEALDAATTLEQIEVALICARPAEDVSFIELMSNQAGCDQIATKRGFASAQRLIESTALRYPRVIAYAERANVTWQRAFVAALDRVLP